MLSTLKRWYGSTFGQAACGAVLVWAAFPPLGRLGLWPLAWLAPVFWIRLVLLEKLPAISPPVQSATNVANKRRRLLDRPYFALWFVGFCLWLALLHWLRLPHWATSFGWVALAFYLAFYLPVFVAVSRAAVHNLRVPAIIAVPLVWLGLELARGHLLTGFTMGSLCHTQYRWLSFIQCADIAGAYGASALMMFVAACLACAIQSGARVRQAAYIVLAIVAIAAAIVYGRFRIAQLENEMPRPSPKLRVALIQGSFDVVMNPPPGTTERIHKRYLELSVEAVKRFGRLDLIVWPETMYGIFLDELAAAPKMPDELDMSPAEFIERLRLQAQRCRQHLRETAEGLQASLIVGLTRRFWGQNGPENYNSAVFVPLDGRPILTYDKMHLVMFGEYVPFSDKLPSLLRIAPVNTFQLTTKPGKQPMAFELKGVRFSPNICYETVIPHLIRRHVLELRSRGREPHVLVNLTNDGWFWGSSELEMHLMCGVFRAVECRKPLLIAANTGISAWVSATGQIRAEGPRRQEALLLAEVAPELHFSWYLENGDKIPAIGLWFVIIVVLLRSAAGIFRLSFGQ